MLSEVRGELSVVSANIVQLALLLRILKADAVELILYLIVSLFYCGVDPLQQVLTLIWGLTLTSRRVISRRLAVDSS